MKKALFILVCFSFLGFAIAQNQDSSKFKLGVSINYFGASLANIPSKIKNNQTIYGHDIYWGGKYSLGLNYRGEKKDLINRVSIGFMSSLLLPSKFKSLYELNVSLGHEWFSKKAKWWYYGTEVYFGKCNYEFEKNTPRHYKENFTDGGPVIFSGLNFPLGEKILFRSEINLIGRFWKRENLYSTKQRFAIESTKQVSIELYYKF